MSYLIFFSLAAATVASPGPGVVLTLNNTINKGVRLAMPGIFGLSIGAIIVAGISATGVGVLIKTSIVAFEVMKLIGAVYLAYLGVRMWRAARVPVKTVKVETAKVRRADFFHGLNLQFTNPKAVFFFISIFPQFIDDQGPFLEQFSLLVLTYSGLLLVVHTLYASFANYIRSWLLSPRGVFLVNRTSGITFVFFAVVLLLSNQ